MPKPRNQYCKNFALADVIQFPQKTKNKNLCGKGFA